MAFRWGSFAAGGIQGAMDGYRLSEMIKQGQMKRDMGKVGEVTEGQFAPGTTEMQNEDGSTSYVGPDGLPGAPKGGFTFGDKTFKTMDDATAAQVAAQQGVARKYGDLETAGRIGRDAQQAKLAGIQVAGAERQAKRDERADAYEAGKSDLFKQSKYFQRLETQKAHETAMADYNAKLAAAGNDPAKVAALGPAPAAPDTRGGLLDALHDEAIGIAYDFSHGKGDFNRLTALTQQIDNAKSEGFAKALQAAQAGNTKEEVARLFNESGKLKVAPEDIAGMKQGTVKLGGADVPTTFITLANGRVINTAAELDSLNKLDKIVERAQKGMELGFKGKAADADMIRAQAAKESAGKTEARAARQDAKQAAIEKGLADYLAAEEKGDAKGMAAARRVILANGGKLDKPEGVKGTVTANPLGGAFATQVENDGTISVTPITMEGEKKATTRIAAPGAPASAAPYPDGTKLKKGNQTFTVKGGVPVPD